MKRASRGSKAAALGTTVAAAGGGLYLLSKLGDNARRADKKDVLVQANREIKKNK